MPRRRRGQEAQRAARRTVRTTPTPLTYDQQVEAAWRDLTDPWCCYDCAPHHPDRLLADAVQEIHDYLMGTTP